jgi:hypothetical protein
MSEKKTKKPYRPPVVRSEQILIPNMFSHNCPEPPAPCPPH